MKAFLSFMLAAIDAGGRIGPNDVVTGNAMFSVVMSAGLGYFLAYVLIELAIKVRRT